MASSPQPSSPEAADKMPKGISYILTNEAAERFSFYGMSSILVVFMTGYLVARNGTSAVMGDDKAKEWFHWFTSAVYFTPIIGALISDIWLGKFKTIFWFSILYCVGFAFLTVDQTHVGLVGGLVFIALGSGFIKPCVSANVGDQFTQRNKHLVSQMYSWFYFSINVGACVSMWACPLLLERYGPKLGFGVPGALMVFATVAFYLGKDKYIHIPPAGKAVLKDILSAETLRALGKVCIIFLFVAMFFALFYQSQSAWVLQAEKMHLKWIGIQWLPAQIQFVNSLFIIIMIPLFSYVLYPLISRVFPLTPLRRIGLGMFVTAACFAIPAWVETQITGGHVHSCSSLSLLREQRTIHLIDGTDETWASGSAPTEDDPIEIVLRLRERRAWTLSQVNIYADVRLSPKEVVSLLEARALDNRLEADELQQNGASATEVATLRQQAQQLADAAQEAKAAARAARQTSSDLSSSGAVAAQAAQDIARALLLELGIGTESLDGNAYRPKDMSVFAGDFSDTLIPPLYSALNPNEKAQTGGPAKHATASGWKQVGDCRLENSERQRDLACPAIKATHVLLQIRSNHGAEWVKIKEIEVATSDPQTSKSERFGGEIWPNVAGIGFKPSVGWQFFAYIFLTAGEILASISVLEFAYTQAPKRLKSMVMSLYLLSISLGNAFSALVNMFIQNVDGSSKLPGASYYMFFLGSMLVTAILFIPVARWYPVKEYIQDEA